MARVIDRSRGGGVVSDSRFLVQRYISEGWAVVPIPAGRKAPEVKDWVNRNFEVANFGSDDNVGIRLESRPATWLMSIWTATKRYAERMAARLKAMGKPNYRNGFALTVHEDALDKG